MAKSLEQIEKHLSSIDNLPTLPVIASQLLNMLGSVNVSLAEVSKLMIIDPSITTKVLRIANSAYYGLRKKVDTLRMALVVLGVNEISNIVVGVSLLKTFPDDATNNIDRKKFWQHSAMTAHLARLLSHRLKIFTHGEEFTAGLIHDIGKLIMDQYFHEEYVQIYNAVQRNEGNCFVLEDSILGATHMQIGAWLADKWKIPFHLIESILFHHHPNFSTNNKELVAIIAIANDIANLVDNYENKDFDAEYAKMKKSQGWTILAKHLTNFDLPDFLEKTLPDIENSKNFLLTT